MSDEAAGPGWVALLLPLVVLVVFAVAIGVLAARGGDRGSGNDDAAVERETERLRAEFAARDARQVVGLTSTARQARKDLTPVLEGMAEYLPADEPPAGRMASPAKVEEWRSGVRRASGRFGDPPSGETATNVARASLDAAVDGLESSVLTYEQAIGLEGAGRTRLLGRAASQRDLAVRVWSIGATQLDYINIESGNGHQHVYLPAAGIGDAFTADPAPEGSGARGG